MKKKPIMLRKFERTLCSSGLWDNGFYFLSENRVVIPRVLFKTAVLEGMTLKTVAGLTEAVKITMGASHWLVEDSSVLKEFTDARNGRTRL